VGPFSLSLAGAGGVAATGFASDPCSSHFCDCRHRCPILATHTHTHTLTHTHTHTYTHTHTHTHNHTHPLTHGMQTVAKLPNSSPADSMREDPRSEEHTSGL